MTPRDVCFVAALAIGSSACRDAEPVHLPDPTSPAPPTDTSASLAFGDLASEEITNTSGAQTATWLGRFGHGRSCAVADLDNDGLPDLVIGHPSEELFYLHNESTPGNVDLVPGEVLLDGRLAWAVHSADYDNDGDEDLFVAMGGIEGAEKDVLLRNELAETGQLHFTDATDLAGVGGPRSEKGDVMPSPSAGASWTDFDLDGDLDLYVSQDVYPLRALADLKPSDPRGYDLLYLNNGDGTFTDVARSIGLANQAPTRQPAVLDIDGDGDMDIFENNYTRLSVLWRNMLKERGQLGFEDVTAEFSLNGGDVGYPLESFASAAQDFNQDGLDDLIVFVRGFASGGPYLDGHVLLLNAGGAGFVDASVQSRLNNPFEPGLLRNHAFLGVMGSNATDVNGDGLIDVLIGNGGPEGGMFNQLYVSEGITPQTFDGVGEIGVPDFGNYTHLIDFPAPEDPDVLGMGIEYAPYPYRTHGYCVADFDLDGTVEVFESNGGTPHWGGDASREPDRMFRFAVPGAPRHWLLVRPHGDGVTVPRDALRTRVAATVTTPGGGTRTVYGTLYGSNGFSSSNTWGIHLGLSDAERVQSLEVHWPDGAVVTVDDPGIDRVVEIDR